MGEVYDIKYNFGLPIMYVDVDWEDIKIRIRKGVNKYDDKIS